MLSGSLLIFVSPITVWTASGQKIKTYQQKARHYQFHLIFSQKEHTLSHIPSMYMPGCALL